MNFAYWEYWKRKQLIEREAPAFPCLSWWPDAQFSPAEEYWWRETRAGKKILDIGAGDLRLQRKILAAGFAGIYHTQDIGSEFSYTYRSLDEVNENYEVILCMDVLEHLALEEGLALLHRLPGLLQPGGVLVLQTANARCVRNQLGTDMTHRQIYNATDLWAYLRALGFEVEGCRVAFAEKAPGVFRRLRGVLAKFVVTRIIGADYADNILLVARYRG